MRDDALSTRFDGASALPDAALLGVDRVVHLGEVESTMDEVHAAARAGAAAGLLVVADRQRAGRGRGGNQWVSAPGDGLWMTLLERPADPSAVRVLSLRVGLAIAVAAQPFARDRILVKWPNDLYTGGGKLGGVLIEARWRESLIDWIAIGVGINLRHPPGVEGASSLRDGVSRGDLLAALVPAIRRAARGSAVLDAEELAAWHARDFAVGRQVSAPVEGTVQGIAGDGALLVRDAHGDGVTAVHAGSMVFADGAQPPHVSRAESSC